MSELMSEHKLIEKLSRIQSELKAPKNQTNTFGKYKYRNCEDILEALKPLLHKEGLSLVMDDQIVNMGNRFYVKTIAILYDGFGSISATAYARESETKKGMDEAQITGAASSYARKYALNGLFAIDDTKDADSKKPPVSKPKSFNSSNPPPVNTPKSALACQNCGQVITEKVAEYSKGKLGKELCMDCQKK